MNVTCEKAIRLGDCFPFMYSHVAIMFIVDVGTLLWESGRVSEAHWLGDGTFIFFG